MTQLPVQLHLWLGNESGGDKPTVWFPGPVIQSLGVQTYIIVIIIIINIIVIITYRSVEPVLVLRREETE